MKPLSGPLGWLASRGALPGARRAGWRPRCGRACSRPSTRSASRSRRRRGGRSGSSRANEPPGLRGGCGWRWSRGKPQAGLVFEDRVRAVRVFDGTANPGQRGGRCRHVDGLERVRRRHLRSGRGCDGSLIHHSTLRRPSSDCNQQHCNMKIWNANRAISGGADEWFRCPRVLEVRTRARAAKPGPGWAPGDAR